MTNLLQEQTRKKCPAPSAPYNGSLSGQKEPTMASSTDDQQREAQAMPVVYTPV